MTTPVRAESGSLRAFVLSETGPVREHNEDSFAIVPERGLLVVADGMGGHQAGETASKIVVSALPVLLERGLAAVPDSDAPLDDLLRDAVVQLSQKLREQSAGRPDLSGMGTTVVFVVTRGSRAWIVHMGDSRAYLLRRGELSRLTNDHSVVELLLRQGEISAADARRHPLRGRVSRFVGMEGVVYPDVRAIRLESGDRLLLCTDGLTGVVDDPRISSVLGESGSPEAACRLLVRAALDAGTSDNVTAMVADWAG